VVLVKLKYTTGRRSICSARKQADGPSVIFAARAIASGMIL
jgi:hypothetical protein